MAELAELVQGPMKHCCENEGNMATPSKLCLEEDEKLASLSVVLEHQEADLQE